MPSSLVDTKSSLEIILSLGRDTKKYTTWSIVLKSHQWCTFNPQKTQIYSYILELAKRHNLFPIHCTLQFPLCYFHQKLKSKIKKSQSYNIPTLLWDSNETNYLKIQMISKDGTRLQNFYFKIQLSKQKFPPTTKTTPLKDARNFEPESWKFLQTPIVRHFIFDDNLTAGLFLKIAQVGNAETGLPLRHVHNRTYALTEIIFVPLTFIKKESKTR